MTTWLVFLRAVNVGKRQYPMVELRSALMTAGFSKVDTHIQTGNVRLTSPLRSRAKLEAAIERVLETDRGFTVPVIAFRPAELSTVAADAEMLSATKPPTGGHYVNLLKSAPSPSDRKVIEADPPAGERVHVRDRAVHLLYDKPFHEAKRATAAVERATGVATARNLTVIRALVKKWGA